VYSLVLEVLDCLPRRSGSAEHHPPLPRGALSKLRPHVEAELEALETLEWLRDLTGEELARRRAFVMFLAAIRRSEEAVAERDEPPRGNAFSPPYAAEPPPTPSSKSSRGRRRARYATPSACWSTRGR